MRINHNISALNTQRQLSLTTNQLTKTMEKLSSGQRINHASDGAAELSVSEKMKAQIASLEQASRNVQDGMSFIQAADGGLNEVSSMLIRMRELAVQKSTGTYAAEDKAAMEAEMDALGLEIKSIYANTKMNGKNVYETYDIFLNGDGTTKLTVAAATAQNVSKASAVTALDTAISAVSLQRATYGATENRLTYAMNNLSTTVENLQAAESRVRDTDMAATMSEYTKQTILQQVAQSMLAQSNQNAQTVLNLVY